METGSSPSSGLSREGRMVDGLSQKWSSAARGIFTVRPQGEDWRVVAPQWALESRVAERCSKLARTAGWTESALWTVTGGSDGSYPYGPMVMDTQGHLYGAASYGVGLNSTNPACAPKRQPSRLRYRLQAHAITTDKRAMPGSKARHRFLPNGRRALRNSSVSSMRILLHALRTYFVVHSAC